ncbi:MAG: cation transporter [Williamsia sp.]|nr:cation transporter [Williamsia sp.]
MKPLSSDTYHINLRIQKWIVVIAIVLFLIKTAAYFLTRSVSILTDALESTVNVIAGLIGLYSLYVAAKPRDEDHPYGHGKVEFISAAVEGTMITIAGIMIIYSAVDSLLHPHPLQKLDYGIGLIAITAAVNFIMGYIAEKNGKKSNSLVLVASGKHLQTDTYSTVGIIIGLVLIYFTKITQLDSLVAIVFGFVIVYTGYKIVRSSIAGIMDEADKELLNRMISLLNRSRKENWIDLHNLRIIKYGHILHIDCHLTVPWYLTVNEAHLEIETLNKIIATELEAPLELFVHSDGCLYSQCPICIKSDCPVRQHPFQQRIEWKFQNIISNEKHLLAEE